MGNCIRKESSVQWGGEDWSPYATSPFPANHEHFYGGDAMKAEEETLLAESKMGLLPSSKPTTTEVKIKITKKQLEELLGKADLQGLSVQQLLAQLVKVSDGFEAHQRHWKPALQSIPEVN